jgi:hypothetical protein
LYQTVHHECAALYRFVDSVVRVCEGLSDYPVYTQPSKEFFRYLTLLGSQTKEFLQQFPSEISKTPSVAESRRQKLVVLRASWETLHEYLKPSLEADTLHLPIALVIALEEEFNKIEDLDKIRFTVFHTNKLNYLEVPPDIAREMANDIADLVNGTRFPPYLGLVGIPYSQANSFFMNCLLPHEMGHFAYQEVFEVDAATEIDDALERMEADVGRLDNLDLALCRDTLARWLEEIFCDLFAICLIGPAFSFALIEVTGVMVLARATTDGETDFHLFVQDHPAEVARFAAQLRLLQILGWWDEIKTFDSGAIEVLETSIRSSEHLHVQLGLPEGVTEERLLQCYEELCNWLLEYLPKHTPVPQEHIRDFHDQSDAICDYFRAAVVPSSVKVANQQKHPTAVVLINSAFKFYLEHLPELIDNVEGEDKQSVEARSRYAEKIELWTLKAIEDSRLLTKKLR